MYCGSKKDKLLLYELKREVELDEHRLHLNELCHRYETHPTNVILSCVNSSTLMIVHFTGPHRRAS